MDKQLSVDDQLAFIRGSPKRGVFNVAECNESQKTVGIQDVAPISTGSNAFRHVGEISTFVSLDLQRLGIGRRLSQATFRETRAQGFLKVCATVRADNLQTISFYQSQGFRIIGTAQKHALVRGRYVDEILLEKLLDLSSSAHEETRVAVG